MTKDSFRRDWVLALALLLFVVPIFLFGPDLPSATGTMMYWPVQSHMAATTYFTQDLYSVPAALQKYLNAVVAIDFNHDGFVDLVALQNYDYKPTPILAFTNDGHGHFTESTSQVLGDIKSINAQACIVADFNRDGLDDLFIVDLGTEREPNYGEGHGYFLFIQKPNGTLVNEASVRLPEFPWLPYGAAAGDIDGDGSIDLMVVSTGGPIYQLLVNNGQGYFSDQTARLPVADKPNWWPNNCRMLDVNNDGYPDIFMGESAGHYPQDFIFLNDGTGHFTFAPDNTLPSHLLGRGSGTTSAQATDLNGDGWMDLVLSVFDNVSGKKMPIQILFNNRNGTFRDVSDRIIGPYLDTTNCGEFDRRVADVNGDGWPDLLGAQNVLGGSFTPRLFINHAGLQFEDVTSAVWGVHAINAGEPPRGEFIDIDNDGDMDVIGVYPDGNHVNNQIYVLVNQTPYVISEGALPYPGIPVLRTPGNGDLVGGFQVSLTWNVVPTAYSYRIQVAEDSGFTRTIFDRRVTTNSFQMTDMIGNTTYHWRLQAINTRGTGSWSLTNYFTAALPVYPPANAQLQRLTINYGFFKVYTNRLTWQANPETQATVINYRIYRKPKNESDSSYSLLAELPAATVTYDDRGLRSTQLYTYRITAFSSQGIESEPATIGN